MCDHAQMTDQKHLTTTEAAQALGVGRTSLQRWVREYGLKPSVTTPGGHHRWDLEDLRRQLAERRQTQS